MATIYTLALTGDASSWEGNTFRVMLPLTGGAQDRVRVKFEASLAAGSLIVDHASVGIWTGSDSDTTATPVELLFSGGSGFSLNKANVIVSDWTTLKGFTASNYLIVIFDINAVAGGSPRTAALTGVVARSHAAAASYNSATTPAGSSGWGDTVFAVSLIETMTDLDVPSVSITNIRRQTRMVAC